MSVIISYSGCVSSRDKLTPATCKTNLGNCLNGWKAPARPNQWLIISTKAKAETWATCQRIGLGINTNMFVEAFHKVFKISLS